MIDAKELRIGNWVSYWNETQWEPVLVAGMLTNIRIHVMHQEKQLGVHPGELQPIPLTPELLEKAGFKIVVGQAFTAVASKQGIDLFFLCPAIDETLEVVFAFNNLQGETTRRELKYVHELQNLIFALTGQELNIKL